MSEAYREGRAVKLPDADRVAAYLVTRMPATYAAAAAVLREWAAGAPAPRTVLDVGGGTGAASLAARSMFPEASIEIVERDRALADAAGLWLPDAAITIVDLLRADPLPECDLVIAAYSLGEIRRYPVEPLWSAARQGLIVIEPGTPKGFALVRNVRDELMEKGAYVAAPCPAQMPCPMAAGDWCHLAARVERSSLHRRIKHAELGYEDEKYSYVALSRRPAERAAARVIRRPRQQPGLITLEMCTPAGLRTAHVTKRDREAFREARHAGWGDRWRGSGTL
jgi:ribosomal protein RSM22 (predicted rRNA methylase)